MKVTRFTLPKSLILEVCEPYLVEEKVSSKKAKRPYSMYKFGSFEGLDCQEYIFGCEKRTYQRCFNKELNIPIHIALVHRKYGKSQSNEMVSPDRFSKLEMETIRNVITYSLESKAVMAKYASSHC
jgi:hypothetical protein